MTKKVKCFNCNKFCEKGLDKCPNCLCDDKGWNIGKEELELFRLQDKWILNGRNINDSSLFNIYKILEVYSKKIIKKNLRGKIFLDIDVINDNAHDMATDLLEDFITRPNFMVMSKWQGILFKKFQKVFYNYQKKKIEMNECSLDIVYENSEKSVQEFNDYTSVFDNEGDSDLIYDKISDVDEDVALVNWILNLVKYECNKMIHNNGYHGYIKTLYFLKCFYYNIIDIKAQFMQRYYSYIGVENYKMIDKIMFNIFKDLKDKII